MLDSERGTMTTRRTAKPETPSISMLPAAPAGAADELAAELQRRIIVGDYPVGAPLRQELLAEEFGVSRMPVREALRKLEAAGVVQILPRRGAFVRGPSADEIREAYVVRAELEGLAAERAAELINDSELQSLRGAAELFQTAVEEFAARTPGAAFSMVDAKWPRANDQFHEVILTAAGNQRLHETVLQLHGSFPRNLTWSAISESSSLLRRNVAEHHDILVAIEAGDSAAARRAAKKHVLRSGELVASRYQRSLDRQVQ
jgi:DNA-binding GntR family transcriptional regulator